MSQLTAPTAGRADEIRSSGGDASRADGHSTSGPVQHSLRTAGSLNAQLAMLSPVQMHGGGGDTAGIHQAAAQGISGSSGALPHLDTIQASFGRHDVSAVQAHTDSAAASGTKAMGAEAFASGNHVAFGSSSPSLHVAAHEAAHVVQQRGGVQLKGGVGQAGDAYEQHADQVADLVVQGKSAESLLDVYAGGGSSGAGVQHCVQFWGEPDHYMLGQLGGQKAVKEINVEGSDKETTFVLGDDEIDPSKEDVYRQDGDGTGITNEGSDPDKFFVRGPDGKPMSLGAASRFSGDFTKHALRGGPRSSLDGMPGKVHEAFKKELESDDYDPMKATKEYIGNSFAEKTLMATNANHFYPLSGIEYRRQHQAALQKMWMARKVFAMGGKENKQKGEELARQAIMLEGFAGHFLQDCFAAGHLAPHALGRVQNHTPLVGMGMAGAQVNTWHDLFNALPNGIPTTLGNFHGDYSMDGHDLGYVSQVTANSLLEVVKPWFEGKPFQGNIELPAPDVPAIMRDPVAGPLWRAMCDDYAGKKSSFDKIGRRGLKSGLSKYAVYETSAGSQVSKDEIGDGLDEHVFGGDKPDDSLDGLDKIRGDVRSMVVTLEQVFDYRGGFQTETGITQKFGKTTREEQSHKFNMSMRSSQLAWLSPASNPRKSFMKEFEAKLDLWLSKMDESPNSAEDEVLLGLCMALVPLKETIKDDSRDEWLPLVQGVAKAFADSPLNAPLYPRQLPTPQGPSVDPSDKSASGTAVSASGALLELVDEVGGGDVAVQAAADAIMTIIRDPRPYDDEDHKLLYALAKSELLKLKGALTTAKAISKSDGGKMLLINRALAWVDTFRKDLDTWYSMGVKIGTKNETARRDIIAAISAKTGRYFDVDGDRVNAITARKV